MMPFGVDVLGTLSEKLKQLMNEAKDQHSSFTDLTKLYKEEKINEKDFFSKVLNYVVTSSALTFLMARVILELKSALEKGTTIKDVTGEATSTSSAPQMGGFGIGSFISSGGIVGKEQTMPTVRNEDVSLPSTTPPSKTCKERGTVLPIKARFCSKCGKAQENT
ncbi:MAG: hypothetical protein WBZ36_19480 [Candidatus Nitrosopolaris sp.]